MEAYLQQILAGSGLSVAGVYAIWAAWKKYTKPSPRRSIALLSAAIVSMRRSGVTADEIGQLTPMQLLQKLVEVETRGLMKDVER